MASVSDQPEKILAAVIIDIADAVALGIPGTVIMANVRNRYHLQAQGLLNLIEEAEKQLKSAESQYLSDQERLADLQSSLQGRNPLGTAYKQVLSEMKGLSTSSAKVDEARDRYDDLNRELSEVSEREGRSFGTHVVSQVDDYLSRSKK